MLPPTDSRISAAHPRRHAHGEIGEEDMSNDTAPTAAGRQYAEAHTAHYATKASSPPIGVD